MSLLGSEQNTAYIRPFHVAASTKRYVHGPWETKNIRKSNHSGQSQNN